MNNKLNKMPGFAGEASVYQTINHYRSAGKNFQSVGNTTVTPQGCGWIKGGVCGAAIAGGTVLCTSACLGGPAPCVACWAGALAIVGYGFCRDCIPGWMRSLINLAEGGGGGTGSGSGGTGGGGRPNPRPVRCEVGEKCCEHDENGNCIDCVPRTARCR